MLFVLASVLTAFIQGTVLGSFIQGYQPNNYSIHQWLSPFSMLTGTALIFGYALLGATRLILKTEGTIQQTMFKVAHYAVLCVAFFMVIATLLTPIVLPTWSFHWVVENHKEYLLALPVIAVAAVVLCVLMLKKRRDTIPYWCSIALFLSAYLGFAASSWPYIVPRTITIWQAAAATSSLKFIMLGACIMIPFLLLYTGYSYYIFRGKVRDEIHY